ncbi:GlxA family transcriptional regulator [Poseidonocella sp. HB161398]|uniref:GlxA family transcriptional regulator n=1 Tax=Poseidonocella sp. HB161398 TaxID=2320855 RepID=UPI001109AD52|nr:GlxA family transcriptional regulator [Poseidonocella sp. HB161398]
MARTTSPRPNAAPAAPQRIVFVLMPDFTLLSHAGALDCLRIANRVNGTPLYDWTMVSCDGGDVACSAGAVFRADGPLPETRHGDMIMICGGLDIREHTTKALISWLRREARRGGTIAGICTGAYVLARAGLLDNHRATIHWENHESFAEEFDAVLLSKAVFAHDGNRLTCAGGTAVIDMMLSLIARDHGPDLAAGVADQVIYTAIRTDQDVQRLSVPSRIGVRHGKLSQVIRRMEENIEEPVSPSVLAADAGLSTRQLERLFRRYLARSPKRYYMELRLQKARNLLLQTDMSVINVALASGFASPSHFSKCYRAQYGTTPYRERGAHGASRAAEAPEEPGEWLAGEIDGDGE